MSTLKELQHLLELGKMPRREFIARAAEHVRAGCDPEAGGRLRIGTKDGDPADTLDPALALTAQSILVQLQMRNCLVEVNHRSEAIGELAESWEPSPDAKVWTFELRKGVEFHNGKSFDAQDVLYSINHHRGEDTKSPEKANLGQVTDLKVDGKHTVVFTLEDGNADFPFVLASYLLSIVPDGSDFTKAVGTGGYVLQSWEPGVSALGTRNPNYWKAGHANFDEVETLVIGDIVARTNALKTGEVDVIDDPDSKTVHLLEQTAGLKVIRVPGRLHRTIPMLAGAPPYDNNDVRLALKHGINREHMVKILSRGLGTVGNDHPIAPDYRYYASELPQREYDPDKTKFHLKKADMLDHTFQLHTGTSMPFSGAANLAVLFKEHLAEAGVKMEVVREPDDGYWSNVWAQKPLFLGYWPGYATEDIMFSTAYAGGAPWNESQFNHERFNQLLREARSELDEAKRRDKYVEMQRLVRNEGNTIVPFFLNLTMAATDRLGYGGLSALGGFDHLRAPDRWWFES